MISDSCALSSSFRIIQRHFQQKKMDNQPDSSTQYFDFQSPLNTNSTNSLKFVDMTKDVAFKIKFEKHKCLKINKHFRNNELFQNNFFVFKNEDSNDSSSFSQHCDNEDSNPIEHPSDQQELSLNICTQRKKHLEESKTQRSCSLTFINSSPQHNFTSNHNTLEKQPAKKRKQKSSLKHQDTSESSPKKRKKRRNSVNTETEKSDHLLRENNNRKRNRAGSLDLTSYSEHNTLTSFPEETNFEEGNCFTSIDDQSLIYSILFPEQETQIESQFLPNLVSSMQQEEDLNFNEIDELLNDFSMVSEQEIQSTGNIFFEETNELKMSLALECCDFQIPETTMESTNLPHLFEIQPVLIEDISDLDSIFANIENTL